MADVPLLAALAEVRSRCKKLLTHANSQAEFWGQGLLFFSSKRLTARGRSQNYTPGRMLPTFGVLEWDSAVFVPSPVQSSECDSVRLDKRQADRAGTAVTAKVDAWHAVAGAVLAMWPQGTHPKLVLRANLNDLVPHDQFPKADIAVATAQAFKLVRESRSNDGNASRLYRLEVMVPTAADID